MYYLTSELYNRPMRKDTESLKNVLGHMARSSKAGIQIADRSFRLQDRQHFSNYLTRLSFI